ncbi:MAG: DUF3034 family protein [Lysobacterales bacterium]
MGQELSSSRLTATAGTATVEGTAGGGILPWVMLAGYGDRKEIGCAAGLGRLSTSDYGLSTQAVACSYSNRLELSVARQSLELDGLIPLLGLPPNQKLRQQIIGAKVRLVGDVVYRPYGQLSFSVHHKSSRDDELVRATGATRTSDTEAMLGWGKLFIDGPMGQMLYLNAAARWTRANQGGLLGAGGDRRDSRQINMEAAAAVLPRRDLALGVEYRRKPDNLSFAGEDDWKDLFVAWFPNKHLSVVAAWVDLGSVGTLSNQDGVYLSLAGSF